MDQSAAIANKKQQKREIPLKPGWRVANARTATVATALVLVGLAAGTVVYGRRHAPEPHEVCVRKAASDAHSLFEAAFENPSETNALARIERACAG